MAKKKAEVKQEGRGKVDETIIQKMFEKVEGFIEFLQRLPPNKLIMHPEVANVPENEVSGSRTPYWLALAWYLRDGLGFDRYTDPDNILGGMVTHYYGPENQHEQNIRHNSEWVWGLWGAYPNSMFHHIRADQLAFWVREHSVTAEG